MADLSASQSSDSSLLKDRGEGPALSSQHFNLAEVYQRAYVDINFFSALAIPGVCTSPWPPFYVLVWSILVNGTGEPDQLQKVLRFALGLPRSHAKTTFIKIVICWLIAYDKNSFILLVNANSDLAQATLQDIDNIMSSPNMEAVYGSWSSGKTTDAAEEIQCYYHNRRVILKARGWASGIRGVNVDLLRPEVIFCDDVQTRVNAESPTDSGKLLKELTGTIFKAIAPVTQSQHRKIIYVGNMYNEDCILMKLKQSPYWLSMVTGAILENGEPLWPDLHPLDELMESYAHDEALGEQKTWFAEVMNDPKAAKTSLLPHQLPDPILSCEELRQSNSGTFLTIDPAGFRKNSDDNVILAHAVAAQAGHLVDVILGVQDPMEVIRNAITLALRWNVSAIGVEAVGYQQTLGFWLRKFLQEAGLEHINVVELSPHGRHKPERIKQHTAQHYNGHYFIADPACRRIYTWQGNLYKFDKKDNKDDFLDACAYGDDMITQYGHLIYSHSERILEGDVRVLPDSVTCPF